MLDRGHGSMDMQTDTADTQTHRGQFSQTGRQTKVYVVTILSEVALRNIIKRRVTEALNLSPTYIFISLNLLWPV